MTDAIRVRMRKGTWTAAVAGLALVVLATGCSEGQKSGKTAGGPLDSAVRTRAAFPFDADLAAAGLADHFSQRIVGRGTDQILRGEESSKDESPVLVLARKGKAQSTDADDFIKVTVEVAESGELASSFRATKVDGRPGLISGDGKTIAVKTASGHVYVSGKGFSRGELEKVYRAVKLSRGGRGVPTIDAPAGFELVGRVTPDAVAALRSSGRGRTVPGPPSAFGLSWRNSIDDWLSVVNLPGDAADLDALRLYPFPFPDPSTSARRISTSGGRPGLRLSTRDGVHYVVRGETGGLFVVAGSGP